MLVAKIFRLDRNIYLKWDRGTLFVTKGTSLIHSIIYFYKVLYFFSKYSIIIYMF